MVSRTMLLSCLLSCIFPVLSAESVKNAPVSHRRLLILSDNSEHLGRKSAAITQDIAQALAFHVPMLVSTSVWQHFIEQRDCLTAGADKEDSPEEYVWERFQAIQSILNAPEHAIAKVCLDPIVAKNIVIDRINALLEPLVEKSGGKKVPARVEQYMCYFHIPFNQEEWEVYRVSNAFYLFIPVNYLDTCVQETNIKSKNKNYTEREHACGLVIDHLERVTNPCDIDWMYFNSIDGFSDVASALQKVFLASYENVPYVWDIVLSGHGINSKWYQQRCPDITKVANMEPAEFKSVLDFFNGRVPLNSFWYTTCYGGGIHMQNLIVDDAQTRPFTVIGLCLTDTVSYGHSGEVLNGLLEGFLGSEDLEWNSEKGRWQLVFSAKQQWNDFFSLVEEHSFDESDLNWVWNAASAILPAAVENIPLVNRAHSCDIVTVYPDNCLKLSKEYLDYLASSERQVVLNGEHISYVLVSEPAITIPLECTTQQIPLFISVIPGNAVHHITKITTKVADLEQLAELFRPLKGMAFDKTFVIDEIVCQLGESKRYKKLVSEELCQKGKLVLRDIIVMCKRDELVRFFFKTVDGKLFKIHSTCTAQCDKAHLYGLQKIESKEAQQEFQAYLETLINGYHK